MVTKKEKLDDFLQAHIIDSSSGCEMDPEMFDDVDLPESEELFLVPFFDKNRERTVMAENTRKEPFKNILFEMDPEEREIARSLRSATAPEEGQVTEKGHDTESLVGESSGSSIVKGQQESSSREMEGKDDASRILVEGSDDHDKGKMKGKGVTGREEDEMELKGCFEVSEKKVSEAKEDRKLEGSGRGNTSKGKFPGALHVQICSLDHFRTSRASDSFSMKIEVGGQTYSTPRYGITQPIKIGYHLVVPADEKGVEIKLVVFHSRFSRVFRGLSLSPVRECLLSLTRRDLVACQSRLREHEVNWYNWTPRSIIGRLKNLVTGGGIGVGPLYLLIAYIPEEELPVISAPAPKTFSELQHWIKVRRHAFCLFFAGYLGIRRNSDEMTRRYVKWYGYSLFIFETETRSIVEILDVSVSAPSYCAEDCTFRFSFAGHSFEFFCDTIEKFDACVDSIVMLFGGFTPLRLALPNPG